MLLDNVFDNGVAAGVCFMCILEKLVTTMIAPEIETIPLLTHKKGVITQ